MKIKWVEILLLRGILAFINFSKKNRESSKIPVFLFIFYLMNFLRELLFQLELSLQLKCHPLSLLSSSQQVL